MRYYFAPLEGLTDAVFRKIHLQFFGGPDRYYTPFFSPTVHRALTPREARELPAADTLAAKVIPQILTKVPEDFLWFAGQCRELGYEEVNLNLGCPSGTVTAKGKGSGMLRDLSGLEQFLDGIFARVPLPVSVKTRIGFAESEEWPQILTLLDRYPICELTVHPRVRAAFYKGPVILDAFRYAREHTRIPLCYNGDLNTPEQIRSLSQEFPGLEAVMLGRGLIADPGMLLPGGTDPAVLEQYFHQLLEAYLSAFGGSRNAMFRLKEHWGLVAGRWQLPDALVKELRKTTDLAQYRGVTYRIFRWLEAQGSSDGSGGR